MAISGIFPVFIVMILFMSVGKHCVYSAITDLRLVGGPTSNKGTVEIRIDNGTWETICNDFHWIYTVIDICRQLGFAGASRAIKDTPYGQNSTPIGGLNCYRVEAECWLRPRRSCPKAGAASCHVEGYLGCFGDSANDRVLLGDIYISKSMSISNCIKFCYESTTANYTYAGVEDGNECFCGEASTNYTRHGLLSDEYCQVPCAGDPTESCGDSEYIAVFRIHVETVETTPAVGSTEKVNEVTTLVSLIASQPSSEMTSNTNDAATSSSMTTLLSTPTTLQQRGHRSCVGVGVGEGVVIILLIATIIVLVMYIFRYRKMKQNCNHGHNTHDMTSFQASSSPDKDTGFYFNIQDIRTPVPSSSPAGDAHYSSKIYNQKHGHTTDSADTGIPTESTHCSTTIEKDGLATDTTVMKKIETGKDSDPYIEMILVT